MATWAAGGPPWSAVYSAPVVHSGGEGDTGSGNRDLQQDLDPVDARRDRDTQVLGDERAEDGTDRADDDGEPDGDVLFAGQDQARQRADDQTDDDRGEDAGDVHDAPPVSHGRRRGDARLVGLLPYSWVFDTSSARAAVEADRRLSGSGRSRSSRSCMVTRPSSLGPSLTRANWLR